MHLSLQKSALNSIIISLLEAEEIRLSRDLFVASENDLRPFPKKDFSWSSLLWRKAFFGKEKMMMKLMSNRNDARILLAFLMEWKFPPYNEKSERRGKKLHWCLKKFFLKWQKGYTSATNPHQTMKHSKTVHFSPKHVNLLNLYFCTLRNLLLPLNRSNIVLSLTLRWGSQLHKPFIMSGRDCNGLMVQLHMSVGVNLSHAHFNF